MTNDGDYAAKIKPTEGNGQLTGIYRGYSAANNMSLVELPGGKIIPCRTISTGVVKLGQFVSVSLPDGNTYGWMDSMPR